MKIYFGCTTAQWQNYRKHYFAIRNFLYELRCIILFDWIDDADKNFNTENRRRDIHTIYEKVVSAIDTADAVVIEYTVPNFSSSHQINYALLRRKPTLVLRLTKDNPRFTDSYLDALTSPYLTVKEYTEKNYQNILEEFIGLSSIEQGQSRYNIVLDKKQKYYLDWASVRYHISRSALIRKLIDGQVKSDSQYNKYIKVKK